MFLEKLKSDHNTNFILFPLLGTLIWIRKFIFPDTSASYSGESGFLLSDPVFELLKNSLLIQNLLALVLFLLMAFIVLQINLRHDFIRSRTMISATLFVIMAGGLRDIHYLHPVYFGALFFLVALYRLLGVFDKPKPYAAALDAGLFLGIASLFYLNMAVFFPAFFIGVGILSRETRWRNFVVVLIGFLLPIVFGASYAFLTDSLALHLGVLEQNLVLSANIDILSNPMKGYLVFLGVLILLASLKIFKEYPTKKVSARKNFIVFFLLFLSSVAAVVLIPSASQEMLLVTIIPVTFLVTNYFVFLAGRLWGEIVFLSLVSVVVVMQFLF